MAGGDVNERDEKASAAEHTGGLPPPTSARPALSVKRPTHPRCSATPT
jgi:hypothetical protein